MNYGSSSIGRVLGASASVGGGIAVLPKTSGSFPLTAVAVVTIVSGGVVLLSLIATKLYKRFAK